MRLPILISLLCLLLAGTAGGQVLADRISVLENLHGYYPCMDCHKDQETITTPRILSEEHYEPLEWDDAEGNAHFVPFGRRVAISDLLGQGSEGDLTAETLARIGERVNIRGYMEENDLAPTDSVWTLVHGGGNLWCLNCHDADDRDKLKRIDGELLTFNQSPLLCGGCHGPKLRDWEEGIHGRVDGYWAPAMGKEDATVKHLCVDCHPAHDPAFPSLMPEPGPVTRLDPPGGGKAAHGAADHGEDGR